MILALNIGNSNITFGGYTPDGKLVFSSRLFADTALSSDELLYKIVNMLALYGAEPQQITAVIFSSVVPPINFMMTKALTRLLGEPHMVVGPGVNTGLNIRMEVHNQLGADLVANAVAALEKYAPPIIMIDMGTATTIAVIDDGNAFLGGAVLPGLRISAEALSSRGSSTVSVVRRANSVTVIVFIVVDLGERPL